MCGHSSESTSLPAPSGTFDERFVYRLTHEGKQILAEHGRTNGKPVFLKARSSPAVAELLDFEARRERQRRRRKEARERGLRLGTVCGRWRNGRRLPDLRMSGRWLQRAGSDLGPEYELKVERRQAHYSSGLSKSASRRGSGSFAFRFLSLPS